VDADGIVTITGTTRAAAYPLRSPEIEWGTCDGGEVSLPGVISRLGGDGALLYSSYLCGGPAAAFTPDGSIHVQGRAQVPGGAASVLRLEVPEAPVVSLDQVSNAFSGARGIGPGTLVLLSGTGLGPDSAVNVGWAPQEALPLELGGTQVLFDGQSARIMFTSQGRVFCVTPAGMKYPRATVQIVHAGKKSNIVGVPVLGTPGLLTVGFPDAGLYTAAPGSEGLSPRVLCSTEMAR
jgi:hypothetical protein